MSNRSRVLVDLAVGPRWVMPRGRLLRPALPVLFLVNVGGLLLVRFMFPTLGAPRLAVYGIPLAGALLLLMHVSIRPGRPLRPVHTEYFRPLLLFYLLIFSISSLVLVLHGVHLRFLQEVVFILSPLLTSAMFFLAVPFRERAPRYDYVLGVIFIGLYLLTSTPAVAAIADVFRWKVFQTSSIETESGLAFPLGMLAVHFAARRNLWFALITGLFLLISYKRIALAATVVSLSVLWIASSMEWTSSRSRRIVASVAVVVNLALVFVMLQFGAGRYDRQIEDWFDVPSNQFTMGRRHIIGQTMRGLGIPRDAFGLIAAVPKGLGSSSEYVIRSGVQRDPRARGGSLDSDLLKGLIEFGFLGFVVWIYVFYRVHTFSPTALALCTYWNVVWLTDNTLIYFDVAFVFYTLVGLAFVARDPVLPRAPS